mmetsp:Transcript_42318/g.116723  ORF Transcript_42318/g.116723 Transcript_42318/m.116723 type:complete len:310 (+) Transcript_42318:92-1021(+)
MGDVSFDSISDEDEDIAIFSAISFLVVALVTFFLIKKGCCRCCSCCSCCHRSKKEEQVNRIEHVTVDGKQCPIEGLRRKKSVTITFMLWYCAGLVGAHHFFLDRIVHGFLCVFTLNFFFVGYFSDLLLIPYYVKKYNEQTSHVALQERSTTGFFCRVALVWVVVFVCTCVFVFLAPGALENVGIIDFHVERSGLNKNPYDIVGVPRGTPFQDVKTKYSDSRACDNECKKAFKYFKGEKEKLARARRRGRQNRKEDEDSEWVRTFVHEATENWKVLANKMTKPLEEWAKNANAGSNEEPAASKSHDRNDL